MSDHVVDVTSHATVPQARRADQPDGSARRGPRAGEIELMLSLLDGPQRISSGPIGRCVKRGWCHALIVEPSTEPFEGARVLFGLTTSGRGVLDVWRAD